MKRKLSLFFSVIAWFAVIAQFILMMQNRVESIPETIIRFFSFFTILTNTLVAVYFTLVYLKPEKQRTGSLTAVTLYITIVGLVYQIVLRPIWNPEGMQLVVDELLHSIVPICVLFYWALYENKSVVKWRQIPKWLIYPLVYLVFILIRGNFSNFYPYPFVNVTELGIQAVLINSLVLMGVFIVIAALLIALGKLLYKK